MCVCVSMSLSDRIVKDHDFFMLMIICIYVCMSLSNRVSMDHSCGGMISYAGEWHDEVPDFMRNQVGRVALTGL